MKNAFTPAKILLPKNNPETWSVIACDQFSSEREYWDRVTERVGDRPSTLNMVVPEAYLGSISMEEASLSRNEKMAQYLMDELTKVKHTHVKCEKIESVELLPQKEPVEKEFIVASNRIDVVVAKVYNLSRSASVELFRGKRIFVNGKTQENNSYFLKEKDVVTARGFGKFIYEKQLGQTKKERVKILVSEYI